MNETAIAVIGFAAWALLLLIFIEISRVMLVSQGKVRSNGFSPDNANLSPFLQRLARAHANCYENLPVFGSILLTALAMDLAEVTNSLAFVFLAARIAQSAIHLYSTSEMIVNVRFAFFLIQTIIGVYWAIQLLIALTAG